MGALACAIALGFGTSARTGTWKQGSLLLGPSDTGVATALALRVFVTQCGDTEHDQGRAGASPSPV